MLEGQFYPRQALQFGDQGSVLRYRAQGVNFAGSNDYLTRDGGFTGAADTKLWTGSMWAASTSADGAETRFFVGATTLGGATTRVRVRKATTNRWTVDGLNSAGSTIVEIHTGTNSIMSGGGWKHLMWSFDLADTGKRHLYLSDASALNVVTYTDDSMDWTLGDWAFGANPSGSADFSGDAADVLMWRGVYVDLSVEANRRLFISAAGKPVNPTGAIAALGTPIVRLSGAVAAWPTNKGDGGGFTLNGTLPAAATSPSD